MVQCSHCRKEAVKHVRLISVDKKLKDNYWIDRYFCEKHLAEIKTWGYTTIKELPYLTD
jgi:hypothetical protein